MRTTTVSLICMLLLLCGVSFAQEDSLTQKATDLLEQGHKAYSNKEYQQAIDAYLEAITYPGMEDWKQTVFYNVSCSYSLLGEANKAFEYLDSSIEAGYSNYRHANVDGDFEFLRKNYADRFAKFSDRMKAAKAEEIVRKTPVAIVEYDNYNGLLDIASYDWGDINRPEMDTLRTRYHLREVMGNDGDELTRMKRLLNWVSTRWVHDGSKMAPVRTALAILGEVDKGGRFCCANYADVLIGCFRSLGYPIRFAGLRSDDAAYKMGGGHGCVEIWSNEYQKWILLDGQNNAWWQADSIPLSAYECHQLFTTGREDELKFVGQHQGVDYNAIRPSWIVYFYHVFNYWMGKSIQLESGSVTPELVYQGFFENSDITDQFKEAYPSLNRTSIILRNNHSGSLDSLTVILSHTMPYFDHFMVRIGGANWEESPDTLPWVLTGGENTIEAKAVNAAGVEGKPSRIVVRYNSGH
jgi:hypothetical protein